MHVEMLPANAQQLVESTSNPRQDLVLGYWREVLELPVGDLAERVSEGLATLRDGGRALSHRRRQRPGARLPRVTRQGSAPSRHCLCVTGSRRPECVGKPIASASLMAGMGRSRGAAAYLSGLTNANDRQAEAHDGARHQLTRFVGW